MTTITEARDNDRAWPVWLVEITLRNGGPTLYFSDRTVTLDGNTYNDYLRGISGPGEEIRRADSSSLEAEATISFKNERYGACEHLIEIGDTYPFDGAECVIREGYLDEFGEPSEAEVVFRGFLGPPEGIDEAVFSCGVLAPDRHRANLWRQEVVDAGMYPNAYEDAGRVVPIVYGEDVLMPALRTDWGARTTLLSAISESATSLELSDASRFPGQGAVWVDNEKIGYGSKQGNVLMGLARGSGGTAATVHRAGADAREDRAEYESILACHELHSVGDVFAEIQGRLWRVASGVNAVASGGRHYLRAAGHVRVDAVAEDIGVRGTYTPEERTVRRVGSDIPVQQRYFNATGQYEAIAVNFPSAPPGTLSDIRTRITWCVKVQETFTGEINFHAGPGGSYPKICTVKGDGTVKSYMPSSFESPEGSWAASKSVYYTATANVPSDKVVFSISEAVEQALATSDFGGDPQGGVVTKPATSAPLQRDSYSSGGYYAAVTANFPFAPPGTLAEVRTRFSWNLEVVEAPNTMIDFFTGPGSTYPKVCTVKADGTLLSYLPELEVSRSGWMSSASIYYSCPSNVPAGKVVFTVSAAEQKARTSSEASVVQLASIGAVVATHSVERFHAMVSGAEDPDGNYGGAGTLIERPDHVIKHFLVRHMGFALSDIEAPSFSAAGGSYASAISGGYRFAFAIMERLEPADFVRRLAFECRSVLRLAKGTWRLDFVPDVAPEAVSTVKRGELAGEHSKFVFQRGSAGDLANDVTARFRRDYCRLGSETGWLGILRKDWNDTLSFFTSHAGGGGNEYTYWQFWAGSYAVQPGDFLEYDIYCDAGNPAFHQGVEIEGSGWSGRGLSLRDQNGLLNHLGDLSTHAMGKWYSRKVALSAAAGKVMTEASVDNESNNGGNYKAYYANLRITDGAGSVRQALWQDGEFSADQLNYASGASGYGIEAVQMKYLLHPAEFAFEAVRDPVMAEDVLDHILISRRAPLLVAEFPVFYGHLGLSTGDTIAIESPLFGGRKFYIEGIRRLDRFRARVRAKEWWS